MEMDRSFCNGFQKQATGVYNLKIYFTNVFPFIACTISLLTIKAPAKNASENVVCFSCLLHTLLINVSVEANSVDHLIWVYTV